MRLLILMHLLGGTIVSSHASVKQKCCPNGELITMIKIENRTKPFCGDNNLTYTCTGDKKRYLIKDIVLDGDILATKRTPDRPLTDNVTSYCIAEMYRNDSQKGLGVIPVALFCYRKPDTGYHFSIMDFLPLVSIPFLTAVIVVYIFLLKKRSLQDFCYMGQCFTMGIAYLTNVSVNSSIKGNIITQDIPSMCTTAGFLMYAGWLASFFSMNVTCINLYISIKRDASHMRQNKWKYFLWYNCYVWGATLVFVVGSLIADNVEGNHWKPRFGELYCWINGRTEKWIFFRGPLSVILTSNVILFILSSYKIWRSNDEIHTVKKLKYRFNVTLKLFLITGINWFAEVFFFWEDGKTTLGTIFDIYNVLQGPLLFLMLVVLRKSIIQELVKRNCCLSITRPLLRILSTRADDYVEAQESKENSIHYSKETIEKSDEINVE